MKSSKAILIAIIAVLVIGGGVWTFVLRDNKKTNSRPTSTTNKQASVDIPKTATETMLESYTGDDYDRFYIANMIAHHQGAVDMAKLAQTNAKHEELKTMANDIISAQTTEINNMLAWQKAWGYPASSGEMMIDHSAMNMTDDMANAMKELEGKTGDEFDKAFLTTMIAHHESAVAMSRPGIKNAGHQEVKDLAKVVIDAQTKEIAQMRQWQAQWGYKS